MDRIVAVRGDVILFESDDYLVGEAVIDDPMVPPTRATELFRSADRAAAAAWLNAEYERRMDAVARGESIPECTLGLTQAGRVLEEASYRTGPTYQVGPTTPLSQQQGLGGQ